MYLPNQVHFPTIIPQEIIFDNKSKKTIALDIHTVIILISLSRKRL
jgi:hypothetical protein